MGIQGERIQQSSVQLQLAVAFSDDSGVSEGASCTLSSARTMSIFIVGLITDLGNLSLAFIKLRMQKSYHGTFWELLYRQVRAYGLKH